MVFLGIDKICDTIVISFSAIARTNTTIDFQLIVVDFQPSIRAICRDWFSAVNRDDMVDFQLSALYTAVDFQLSLGMTAIDFQLLNDDRRGLVVMGANNAHIYKRTECH